MRRVFERVVFPWHVAVFNRADFFADRQHRVAEPVEFGLGLAFRRLDHQGARDRPRHRWRVEPCIHQPFGDIVHRDMRAFCKGPRVDDALMGDAPCWPLVEHVKRALEPLGDVVGVQDRDACRLRQPLAAHHQNISPRDRQQAGRAERGCRNRPVCHRWDDPADV